MTDEQIIQSLPPGLQGDLKEFGPLENKRSKEIHQFMLDMREKYKLAPWSPFTQVMKHAANAADAGTGITSENMWCRAFAKTEGFIDDNNPDWCLLNVTATNKEGNRKATGHYAVHPDKDLVWSLQTESPVKGSVVTCYKKGSYQRGIKRSVLMNEAEKLLRHNQHTGEVVDVAKRVQRRQMTESPVKHKPASVEAKPVPQEAVEQMPLFTQQPAEPQKSSLTEVQKATLLIVFEMGAAKARELGMHSTIARWRTELAPVIGPEVHHVND